MKKKILIVMNNLNCGGAEKALISLLETIDYSKYNIDLLLFKKEGVFLSSIPNEVNLLDEINEIKYFDMSIKKAIYNCLKRGRLDVVFLRTIAGWVFKTEKNKARCEQRVWRYLSKSLKSLNKTYDTAIGFLEKNPVYFCIDKVKANTKIGFIHNDYLSLGMDDEIDKMYFPQLNYIVTVSQECANVLKRIFPSCENKIQVMHNIVSPNIIKKLSLEYIENENGGISIISMGRLTNQKGFDIAIEACKILRDSNYDITWRIIGEGEDRSKLEKIILQNNLQDHFLLLGLKENPYPYIHQADIYVQPSRFEGKSIAIDEAKIINKPIVTTNFTTVNDQITHEVNGLISEMNPESLAFNIKKLINNNKLRDQLKDNLSKEDLGTEKEILKFYRLLNDAG